MTGFAARFLKSPLFLTAYFVALATVNLSLADAQNSSVETIRIAAAGDWSDKWEAGGLTRVNLEKAGTHDLVAMLGDLSYDGADSGSSSDIPNDLSCSAVTTSSHPSVVNACNWCANANDAVGDTPIIFVPGDHDSIAQDGNNLTYAGCLNSANGSNGVSAPQTTAPGSNGYVGKYPFLYYTDLVKGNVKVRVVGTTIAYQEEQAERAEDRKYLTGYGVGGENYQWLENVYGDAKGKGYWLVHINHLPCIDMGKNKEFKDCQAVTDLNARMGVNLTMDGSSHNVWRTKPLRHGASCSSVQLTTTADGANPSCVGSDNPNGQYFESDGFINAHAGTGGKDGSEYPELCDPNADGEVAHYAADGTCFTGNASGFISLEFFSDRLVGDFIRGDGSIFEPYHFEVFRNGTTPNVPSDPTGPIDSVDPNEPTDPNDSSDPVNSSNPVDDSGSDDASDSNDSSDPSDGDDSSDDTESSEPTDTDDSSDPSDTGDSDDSSDSMNPIDMGNPVIEKIDLRGKIISSTETDNRHLVENLHDGCTDKKKDCTTGAKGVNAFTVRFDLGEEYTITGAKLFGDARGKWISESWHVAGNGLSIADSSSQQFFPPQNAYGDEWFEYCFPHGSTRGTEVTLTVYSSTGSVQFREFELYGYPTESGSIDPYCGDGVIDTGETPANCCIDTGCQNGSSCVESPSSADEYMCIDTSVDTKLKEIDLDGTIVSATQTDSIHRVENLYDNCTSKQKDCTVGARDVNTFVVEFDLGRPVHLAKAELFGDDTGNWISENYSIEYRDLSGNWVLVGVSAAFGQRYFEMNFPDVETRGVRLTVDSSTGSVQFRELKLYEKEFILPAPPEDPTDSDQPGDSDDAADDRTDDPIDNNNTNDSSDNDDSKDSSDPMDDSDDADEPSDSTDSDDPSDDSDSSDSSDGSDSNDNSDPIICFPSDVLDLSNWKITLPTGSDGPDEIKQPALDGFSSSSFFKVSNDCRSVIFRAPVTGVTTSGSSYPRSELREMTSNGSERASWSGTSGTHSMFIDQAIHSIPTGKPHVVAGQIHDSDDDVIVIRLEGTKLYVNVDGSNDTLLESNYQLGTRFTVEFVAGNGKIEVYYNGASTPAKTINHTKSGNYFKAGAYTQANCDRVDDCSDSNYGEVEIFELRILHF